MWPLLESCALPTFWRFAERFDYDVVAARLPGDGADESRQQTNAARWAKIGILREALARHELVVWLDADIMICRFDDDVSRHLAPDKFQAFALEQVPQDRRANPNTGVWVLRSGRKARAFLDAVERAGQQYGPWADQGAVIRVLGWDRGHGPFYHGAGPGRGSRFLKGTGWLPPSWNQLHAAQGEDQSGVHAVPRVAAPYAVHFAGLSVGEREPLMRELAARLAQPAAAAERTGIRWAAPDVRGRAGEASRHGAAEPSRD
jgi:hypothetical protein